MGAWPRKFEDLLVSYLSLAEGQSIEPDVPLSEYGFDSFALVGLMIDLELAFDFAFPEELVDLRTFETGASLWAAVSQCLAAQPARTD